MTATYHIIVDTRHLAAVLEDAAALGVTSSVDQENAGLDLARVAMTGPGEGDDQGLDALLASLRATSRFRHAGWEPTIGKDRALHRLHRFGDEAVQPLAYHVSGGIVPTSTADDTIHPLAYHVSGGGSGRPSRARSWAPDVATGGAGVRVAVLDTRVCTDPFAGFQVTGASTFAGPVAGADPSIGHGTFVTGCVFTRAPQATVLARHVLSDAAASASTWDVAAAAVELATAPEPVQLLNLSLGCLTGDGAAPLVLERMVQRLAPVLTIVAATGNEPHPLPRGRTYRYGAPVWPAALADVVAVGASAHDAPTELAQFTAHGVPWADVLAPGVRVTSAYVDGTVTWRPDRPKDAPKKTETFAGAARWSGSSFSSGLVTGYLATKLADGVAPRDAIAALEAGPDGNIVAYPRP